MNAYAIVNCPSECKSKLEHYCCCPTAFYSEDCLAPDSKHECICEDIGEDNICRLLKHF